MTPAAPARFDSAAVRADYERDYAKLMDLLPVEGAASLLQRFHELESRLDAGMIEAKSALLISSLLTSDEDQALGAWIFRQHANLARLGRCVVEMGATAGGLESAALVRAIALAFLHWGEAVKWELMVGRKHAREYALLHGLMRTALDAGHARAAQALQVDGLERRASIEALYFRTLILDRFTSGNLTRQEIEVLDAWLWEWAPQLASDAEAEVVWRADLDSDAGLRYGRRRGEGPSLYLPLAPLEAQRQDIIRHFHRGYVVPDRGRAAQMRIEAHVAVLQQLRHTFSGTEDREYRQAVEPVEVEAWVGIAEVTHALRTEEKFAGEPRREDAQAAGKDAFDKVYDKPRRMVTLRDMSFTGYLAEVPAAAAGDFYLNEVVAVRAEPDQAPLLARVARRVFDPDAGAVSLGLELLCDPLLQPRTAMLRGPGGAEETYIFVPGVDGAGRRDGFLVPYRVVQSGEPCTVGVDGREYTLAFNRVRRRGRGWVMAGFEILGVR